MRSVAITALPSGEFSPSQLLQLREAFGLHAILSVARPTVARIVHQGQHRTSDMKQK
jgi:hypothetical protein